MGHADLHRVVKEMVRAEVVGRKGDAKLNFCTSVSSILVKDLEATVSTRAVFILIELIEKEVTKQMVWKQVMAKKAQIQKLAQSDKSTGLSILIKKMNE